MSIDAKHYRFLTTWSESDAQFVGTCTEFPSLSWLEATRVEALAGIVELVEETIADIISTGEALPQPLDSQQSASLINGRELQALRKFLMLDVREAAEMIGQVSPRSWQYWEAERSKVPNDVADKMTGLLTERQILIETLESRATSAPYQPHGEKGKRLQLPYHLALVSFEREFPEKRTLEWRIYQSALAELYANNLINLV